MVFPVDLGLQFVLQKGHELFGSTGGAALFLVRFAALWAREVAHSVHRVNAHHNGLGHPVDPRESFELHKSDDVDKVFVRGAVQQINKGVPGRIARLVP